MHRHRFDGLAREAAGFGSRRALLRAVAVVAAAGWAAALSGRTDARSRCARPGRPCSRERSCCAGARCRGGKCQCRGGRDACGGRCRVPCPNGQARNPETCGCCALPGQLCDGCCSNTCTIDGPGQPSVCVGLAQGDVCTFAAECASGACAAGACA